jgi:plasmid stabilization system protein ParE
VDFKLLYTQPALADLEEVMRWSWEKHPETSERFGRALLGHLDLLKDFPRLGRSVKG